MMSLTHTERKRLKSHHHPTNNVSMNITETFGGFYGQINNYLLIVNPLLAVIGPSAPEINGKGVEAQSKCMTT